ncbi:Threonine aldolase OS=Streptomyces albaduncus OX=68172 GN=FHS32_002066 PE=3 SV=1 [Streptomyces griseoloalbus]
MPPPSLDVPLSTSSSLELPVGVDLLSLGGTKNGALFGEAVVLWDMDHGRDQAHEATCASCP